MPRGMFFPRALYRLCPGFAPRIKKPNVYVLACQKHSSNKSSENGNREKIKIQFVEEGNENKIIMAEPGKHLLDVAHENGVGLEGACEASLACSTCHVILEESYYKKLEEPSDEESDLLDLAFGLTETSRLGCQVTLDKSLDGMSVKVPSITRNIQYNKLK